MKKRLLIPVLTAALAITGVVIMGAAAVSAQDNEAAPSIVQRLAERFGLNHEEVQSVFDELHEERMQRHQIIIEERLDQAVADGVITDAQKEALLAKKAEIREKRDQHHEEMQAWMDEQGIDPEKLAPYGGFGHHGMHMKWNME